MELVGYDDNGEATMSIELTGAPFMMSGGKIILPTNKIGRFDTDGSEILQLELVDGSNIKIFDDRGNLVFAFRNYHANATKP